jgi:hypothetical protein
MFYKNIQGMKQMILLASYRLIQLIDAIAFLLEISLSRHVYGFEEELYILRLRQSTKLIKDGYEYTLKIILNLYFNTSKILPGQILYLSLI